MKLYLKRQTFTPEATVGQLLIDGRFECWTLEDTVREQPGVPVTQWKIPGKTAIPVGEYEVIITFSNRFGRELPQLVDVPGYTGVRIHPGNTAEDTEGCLLVGRTAGHNTIFNSQAAMMLLFPKIEQAYARGERITLKIEGLSA